MIFSATPGLDDRLALPAGGDGKPDALAGGNRTTGPKTASGKLASSKNVIQTGAYAVTIILPGEQEEKFLELKNSFINDFRPNDTAEISKVHDLAILTWKELWLDKLEQKVILEKLNRPISSYETNYSKLLNKRQPEEYQRCFGELSDEEIQSYKKYYKYAQHLHQKNIVVEKDTELVESDHPFLLKTIQRLIEHYVLVNSTIENVIQAELKLCLETFIHDTQALIWYCEHRPQIKEEIQMIKDRRLLELMEVPTTSRARDDLSHDFYRTLTELRRHQAWRQS